MPTPRRALGRRRDFRPPYSAPSCSGLAARIADGLCKRDALRRREVHHAREAAPVDHAARDRCQADARAAEVDVLRNAAGVRPREEGAIFLAHVRHSGKVGHVDQIERRSRDEVLDAGVPPQILGVDQQQQSWPVGAVLELRPRAGAWGTLRCVLDSLLRRRPSVRYLGPPIEEFDSVILVAPIWLGRLAGPMRGRTSAPSILGILLWSLAKTLSSAVIDLAYALVPA